MTRWWRAYDEALFDPKVQNLPPALFKFWFNILCVASKYDGVIPPLEDLKGLLKARLDHLKKHLEELLKRGLLDEVDGHLEPHNWLKRQFKSDNSTDRVRAHRNAKRNVSVTPPEYRVQSTEIVDDKSSTIPTPSPGVALEPISVASEVPQRKVLAFPAQPSTPSKPLDLKTEVYALARETLGGKNPGSAVGRLLKANGGDFSEIKRVLVKASEKGADASAYFWEVVHRKETKANQEALEAQQLANWRPRSADFPPRDIGDPRQRFYLISEVQPGKRLYFNDPGRVLDLVYAKADELGVVL